MSPHRLGHLNTWAPDGDAVCRGEGIFEMWCLPGRGISWRVALKGVPTSGSSLGYVRSRTTAAQNSAMPSSPMMS